MYVVLLWLKSQFIHEWYNTRKQISHTNGQNKCQNRNSYQLFQNYLLLHYLQKWIVSLYSMHSVCRGVGFFQFLHLKFSSPSVCTTKTHPAHTPSVFGLNQQHKLMLCLKKYREKNKKRKATFLLVICGEVLGGAWRCHTLKFFLLIFHSLAGAWCLCSSSDSFRENCIGLILNLASLQVWNAA